MYQKCASVSTRLFSARIFCLPSPRSRFRSSRSRTCLRFFFYLLDMDGEDSAAGSFTGGEGGSMPAV